MKNIMQKSYILRFVSTQTQCMSYPSLGSKRNLGDYREEHPFDVSLPESPSRKKVERREGHPVKHLNK
jgi:hypothetical protein